MLNCFSPNNSKAIKITPVIADHYAEWLSDEDQRIQNWLQTIHFDPEKNSLAMLPDEQGKLKRVFIGLKDEQDYWAFGALPAYLSVGSYQIEKKLPDVIYQLAHLAWGLGSYQFSAYKKQPQVGAKLILPAKFSEIDLLVHAIYLVRDLINTPAEDMGPADLAEAAISLADEFGAHVDQIIGEDLLKKNFPAIYAVGKGSQHSPRLIEFVWGNSKHPKVTLIGKGVCFDSGGLNIKSSGAMLNQKKDMGGAAHVLGLAYLIMASEMPIRLRVLIPAVENAVSDGAYRPGDILATRKGLSVEVTNTDAEGRLILSDALTYACEDEPDCIIDIATLTGAARVALGPEVAAIMSNSKELAQALCESSQRSFDPIWELPLYKSYLDYLESPIADIRNSGLTSYAGALTAGLFLQHFIKNKFPWAHFDIMAWNDREKPGHPVGGEAMGLRAIYAYLKEHFK